MNRRKGKPQKLSRAQREAVAEASRLGLYLLVEGRGERWVVYCGTTGRQLATFFPSGGKVLSAGNAFEDFHAADARDALNRIRQQVEG